MSPEYILNILKTECGYRDGDSILVGVSGGADSVALLHLIHAAGISCAAAHVNYGLRGEESDGDEQFVSELCAKLNVPLYTRRTDKEELISLDSNLQNAARLFRFRFFQEIVSKESMNGTALAHHKDDQLETILMNFMRGAGLDGLCGMKPKHQNTIRPLLKVDRAAIEIYLQNVNLSWRNDSSNASSFYTRNKLRNEILPLLKELHGENSSGWETTVNQLHDSKALLTGLMRDWSERVVYTHVHAIHFRKKELLQFSDPRLLLKQLLHQEGFEWDFSEEQFNKLMSQQPGKRHIQYGLQLLSDRDDLILTGIYNPAFSEFELSQSIDHPEWSCTEVAPVKPEQYKGFEALVSCDSLTAPLMVRVWKEGDRIAPLGMTGTRKVSDVLTELKIPYNEKSNYPVITCKDEIAWIPGYRIAEKYKVTPETKTALHIKWNR